MQAKWRFIVKVAVRCKHNRNRPILQDKFERNVMLVKKVEIFHYVPFTHLVRHLKHTQLAKIEIHLCRKKTLQGAYASSIDIVVIAKNSPECSQIETGN